MHNPWPPPQGNPVPAEDESGEQAGRLFAEWRFNGTVMVTLLQRSPSSPAWTARAPRPLPAWWA